jgi:SulP family sulfate permease
VEVGVMLAVFLFLRRMVEVSAIKIGTSDLMTQLAYGEVGATARDQITALSRQHIEVYEITGPFFFGVADMLQHILRNLARTPQVLILRMGGAPVIDSTGISAMESFAAQCRSYKIKLFITEIQRQPRQALQKAGFIDALGPSRFTDTIDEAIEAAVKELE